MYDEELIIRVDASTKMGTGHLMRCLALAQAWKKVGGKATFITACQSEGLLERLQEEGFSSHLLGRSYPDPSDRDCTKDILASHPNAWVVLDGYHFDEVYQQWLKEAGHRLLVIDDMGHLKHYYADIVLNQNLHVEQLHYSCEPYTRLLLGTHYVLLRREFLDWRGWKREIPKVARRVLVTLGGSDPENHTLKVIRALQEVGIPDLEATVVIGASNPHASVLGQAAKQSCIPIRLVRDAKNMPELIAQADVAVIAGGVTLWELLFMGCIIISYASNSIQDVFINELERLGIVKHQGDLGQIDQGSLTSSLQEVALSKTRRKHMSTSGKLIVDGKGTERVLDVISESSEC